MAPANITGDMVPPGEPKAGFVVLKCQCNGDCPACDLYWIGGGGRAYSLRHARAAGWTTVKRRWYCPCVKEHGSTYDERPQLYEPSPDHQGQLELTWP